MIRGSGRVLWSRSCARGFFLTDNDLFVAWRIGNLIGVCVELSKYYMWESDLILVVNSLGGIWSLMLI